MRLPKWLIIIVFCLFAGLISETFVTASTSPPLPGLWQLRVMGFLAVFAFFFLLNPFPALLVALLKSRLGGLHIAQVIVCAALLAFSVLVIWRGRSWSQRVGWSPRQNLALLIVCVTLTTLLNLAQVAMGEPFASFLFYALLVALTLRWRCRAQVPQAAL